MTQQIVGGSGVSASERSPPRACPAALRQVGIMAKVSRRRRRRERKEKPGSEKTPA